MFQTISEKVIVGVLTTVTLAAIFTLWETIQELRIGLGVPEHAVVVFDDPSGCPKGWKDMGEKWRGSVAVAAVTNTNDKFGFGRTGGSETIDLEPENLPKHSHTFVVDGTTKHAHTDGGSPFEAFTAKHRDYQQSIDTSPVGSGTSVEIMPPYIALYFCKRN